MTTDAELFRFEVPTSRGMFVVIGPDTLPPDEVERIGAQIAKLIPLMVLEPPREEFNERACPACGGVVAASDTHFSLFAGPAGSYVCPVPASKGA